MRYNFERTCFQRHPGCFGCNASAVCICYDTAELPALLRSFCEIGAGCPERVCLVPAERGVFLVGNPRPTALFIHHLPAVGIGRLAAGGFHAQLQRICCLPGDVLRLLCNSERIRITDRKAQAFVGVDHARQNCCDLAAADICVRLAAVLLVAALHDARAVELVDRACLRVDHGNIGNCAVFHGVDCVERLGALQRRIGGNGA